MDGHLGCFHFGVIMNNAAINIHVQVFVWTYVFISLKDTPRNRIAGSYGSSGTSLVVQMADSSTGKESTCNAGDTSSIPRSGSYHEKGIGYPLQDSGASLVTQTVKESACNAGNVGSILGLGRSPGGGHGNPLQDSYLENPHGQRSLAGYRPYGHTESD